MGAVERPGLDPDDVNEAALVTDILVAIVELTIGLVGGTPTGDYQRPTPSSLRARWTKAGA